MSPYSVFAFLIPLPLFFDFASGSFVIHAVNYDKVLVEAGVAAPIGLAALSLIILCYFPRMSWLRMNKATAPTLACLAVFCFFAVPRVEPIKLLVVLLPVLIVLAFSAILSQPRIVKKIVQGYLVGVLFQACLHAASIVFYSPNRESLVSSSRTFFGYEIYQAWVSYSAVLSAAGAACVIYSLSIKNWSSSLRVLMLTIPVYLIVIAASRKAAMLDLAIILLINAFLTLHAIHKETLLYKKRTFTNVFILILVTFSAYMFVAFSVRDNSLDFALDQRGGSYVVFTAEWLTASWVQVMTGYAPGWGGYSNLILELLSRSGLIGMVAYLLGLSFAMMRFYLALFVTVGDDMRALRNNIYMKCWFAFVLMSFVVGNLVNLNIQLPYYTANLLMINVCFVFYYSRYLSETSQVFLTARR